VTAGVKKVKMTAPRAARDRSIASNCGSNAPQQNGAPPQTKRLRHHEEASLSGRQSEASRDTDVENPAARYLHGDTRQWSRTHINYRCQENGMGGITAMKLDTHQICRTENMGGIMLCARGRTNLLTSERDARGIGPWDRPRDRWPALQMPRCTMHDIWV